MNKSFVIRWALILAVLAALTAFLLPNQNEVDQVSAPAPRRARVAPLSVSPPEPAALADEAPDEAVDPFAPRGWHAAPVEPVAVAAPMPVAQPVLAPVPVAPAGPPPIPYKFLGQMEDGGRRVVYLGRGEQLMIARQGETLEGEYKVLSVDGRQIEFEHLPSGTKQVLPIPAAQ